MPVEKLVRLLLTRKFGSLRFTQEYANSGKATYEDQTVGWSLERHPEADGLYSLYLDDVFVAYVESLNDLVKLVMAHFKQPVPEPETQEAEAAVPAQRYYLVSSINSARFETVCNEVLQAGGTPLGGVSTAVKHGSPFIHYAQAFLVPNAFVETEKEDAE